MASPASPLGAIAVKSLSVQIRNGSNVNVKTAEALDTVGNASNALVSAVNALQVQIAAVFPDIITAGFRRSLVESITLTAATMLTYADPQDIGDQLHYQIIQDATGGWAITWDANLIGQPANLDTTPLYMTIVPFVALSIGGTLKWVGSALMNSGVPQT